MKINRPLMAILILITGSVNILGSFSDGNEPIFEPQIEDHIVRSDVEPIGLYGGIVTYEDVALIVNDNSEISKEIGTYFAEKRGIDPLNIINISAPAQETINRAQFDDMAGQIKENLSRRGLTNKINYMVTTKGVPLRVSGSNWNMASVDSELMLLDGQYEGQIHSSYFFENPFFQDVPPEEMTAFSRDEFDIRLVTRLTGYTKEEAMRLVDLAEDTLNSRGRALLDMDPRKGISSGGYGIGNLWMYNANTWLDDNGWETHLDNNNTFVTGWNETMAYFSWGSNDGDWGISQMTNTGFESGSSGVPSSWTIQDRGGVVERTRDAAYSGSWSLNMTRTGDGTLRAYQDITLNFQDHRFIADGKLNAEGVTSPGARIILEGYDMGDSLVWGHELANRTGTFNWASYQDPLENDSSVVKIRFILELLGEGNVFFDSMNLRVIRPHNEWIPGSIAETCVSTGGRSQTYGTWYGQSLIADLIRDGVTGVKGYAWEPFLSAISHADILMPAYYSGFNLAESFWMGSELASWMGYVVGDPKCAPFLNERPDMGFIEGVEPVEPFVDEEGIPHLSIRLHNKGNNDVVDGKVELFIEGDSIWKDNVDIPAHGDLIINISSDDEPIAGNHEFSVVLNGDASILEYDTRNNLFVGNLTVNSIPDLNLDIERTSLRRTEVLNITATIKDEDRDISFDNLDLLVESPYGRKFVPDLITSDLGDQVVDYHISFTPPWNASLGFYSLRGTYTDPDGSFSTSILSSSFRVLNYGPSLLGKIGSLDVERGGTFMVNLTWDDPDTPDGDLEVTMHGSDALGGRLEPSGFTNISSHQGQFEFTIPADEGSGNWMLSAEVRDRDDAIATWSETIRTFNLPASMFLIYGGGMTITRLEDATFTIGYSDPEGLPSSSISVLVVGPTGSGGGTPILEKDIELGDGENHTIKVDGKGLAIGDYTLRVDYQDDEREGGTLTISPIFTVIPIAPEISIPVVTYGGSNGDPGGSYLRGDSISFYVPIEDKDGGTLPLDVEAYLIRPDGGSIDVFLEARGNNEYRTRISTDGSWGIGPYSLNVEVIDGDGQNATLFQEVLFVLDADLPLFDQGEVYVRLNSNFTCTTSIQSFPSSSRPVSVTLFLFDENGTEAASIDLLEEGGFGSWKGEGTVIAAPEAGSLWVMDDLGRNFWLNGTFDIEIEKEDKPIDTGGGDGGNDNSLVMAVIILSLIILLILISVMIFVLARRRRSSGMIPAPPMATPINGPPTQTGLSGYVPPSLPSMDHSRPDLGPRETPTLPPGSIMRDGGSYHRPMAGANDPGGVKAQNIDLNSQSSQPATEGTPAQVVTGNGPTP